MNSILNINTEYLRACRTIETVLVSTDFKHTYIYIYNYKGISFRVFKNLLNLINFFQNKIEEDYHFSTEEELDEFLFELDVDD